MSVRGLLDASLMRAVNIKVRSDEDIRQRMLDARVVEDMYRSLEQPLHWQHASTQNTRDVSVERPHNQVHVAMGSDALP